MLEKRAFDFTSEEAVELPDRDMMALINIIVFDLIDGGVLNNLTIEVKNNNVAAQICAAVGLLNNAQLGVSCTVTQ